MGIEPDQPGNAVIVDPEPGYRAPTPHVFALFHSDPEIVEVTVRYRDGSGGRYAKETEPVPGACGDPECHVLHADRVNPIHPPDYVDSRRPAPPSEGEAP